MAKLKRIDDLGNLRKRLEAGRKDIRLTVIICGGTGCQASQSPAVIASLKKELARQGAEKDVCIRATGCHGFCEQGPLMVFEPGNLFYCHVTPEDGRDIVSRTVMKGEVIERLLYKDPRSGKKIRKEAEIPFYKAQDRRLLSYNRLVDPCSIEDYIAIGGYTALAKVLASMKPGKVIEEISASGLRGRGGGGFLTGRKWAECAETPGDEKYVICNADEGDPGAYMDRCLLEADPHLIFEGMMIGAWAVGAAKGYVYVRNEYPLAVKHAKTAVQQARKLGLLGDHILGSNFSFDIDIARGGGAFVCGESTALMVSLEGKVGEPRPKDVHTAKEGLWNRPTVLNNVETWANAPSIIVNGANWFAATGTKSSKGTKIFALTGQVMNTGLVEIAMGTTLKGIVFDIGGGSKNGKAIKAVQTGGPSGGCLPVGKLDLPVDFDTLHKAGSMMGSGGMVVMDEGTCMVDVAKYFLKFLRDESCGKCVPCRIGIDRMLEIVTDITEGRGKKEQIPLLMELAETVNETSLCGLGKTAGNPVLSTLRYFPDEYATHVNQQKCPAGVCRSLIRYAILAEKCTGCGSCLRACAYGVITGKKKQVHVIDAEGCRRCGICVGECKFEAIMVQ
ncbi:MAG TPA: NADH-ubiquinone oxidoreductase-F iron-sulfur binding region domain-containing protein [Syntrophales bacterium]|nr:NADH-ubiquinone oxidoreductase-F iron-sulfur binding region domain-containing protein [Syntrophales bacterium]